MRPRHTPAFGSMTAFAGVLLLGGAACGPGLAAETPPSPAEAISELRQWVDARHSELLAIETPSKEEKKGLKALGKAVVALGKPTPAGLTSSAKNAAAGLKAIRGVYATGVDEGLDGIRSSVVESLSTETLRRAAATQEDGLVLRSAGVRGKVVRLTGKVPARVTAAVDKAEAGRPDAGVKLLAGALNTAAVAESAAAKERTRTGTDTFDRVRDLFAASCNTAGCHGSADAAAGLDLEGRYAWGDLRLRAAVHPGATARGRRLVVPGDPDASFLFTKCADTHESDEGDAMPGPGAPLAEEDLETLRRWILAGAPPSGPSQVVLRTPAEGFQVRVPPIPVSAGGETQIEFLGTVPGTGPRRVTRVEFLLPPGHRIARVFESTDLFEPGNRRDLPDGTTRYTFEEMNLEEWSLRAATPQGALDWTLPPGTGIPVTGGRRWLAQVHFDDLGVLGTPAGGSMVVNLHTVAVGDAPATVGTMFGQDKGLLLAPGSTSSRDFGATFQFLFMPGAVDVLGVFGATRSRGVDFEVRQWDGLNKKVNGAPENEEFDRMGESARLYRNLLWETPAFVRYAPGERTVPQGSGIVFRGTFHNEGTGFIPEGPLSLHNEVSQTVLFFTPGPADGRTLFFPQPSQ